jgi:hypothetical protein
MYSAIVTNENQSNTSVVFDISQIYMRFIYKQLCKSYMGSHSILTFHMLYLIKLFYNEWSDDGLKRGRNI